MGIIDRGCFPSEVSFGKRQGRRSAAKAKGKRQKGTGRKRPEPTGTCAFGVLRTDGPLSRWVEEFPPEPSSWRPMDGAGEQVQGKSGLCRKRAKRVRNKKRPWTAHSGEVKKGADDARRGIPPGESEILEWMTAADKLRQGAAKRKVPVGCGRLRPLPFCISGQRPGSPVESNELKHLTVDC